MWQPAPIEPIDATLWATDFLRAALAGRPEPYASAVHVSAKVPKSRLPRMVIVRRDGGTANGLVDYARLSLRVWAPTEQQSTDLTRLCIALLRGAPGSGPVTSVTHDGGPTPTQDESGEPIRYVVVTVGLLGAPLAP